eukprot:SAG31_NODE_44287_length_263_cov_0.939024_1_plen_62_part_10
MQFCNEAEDGSVTYAVCWLVYTYSNACDVRGKYRLHQCSLCRQIFMQLWDNEVDRFHDICRS